MNLEVIEKNERKLVFILDGLTIEMVNGPNVTTEELRHMEGQRYIVGLIENRMNHAHKVKNNGTRS